MSNNGVAFFIGLFGSVHCVGMCGPLALSVSSFQSRWWLIVLDKVLYNFGRIITYSFLGLMVGIIGKQLWLYGLQQGVSILSGALIIAAGFSRIFKIKIPGNNLLSPISRLLNYALQHKAGHLITGMLNGFLPCGFVYLALVGAINMISPLKAAAYMCWFGVGTFPLMLLAMVGAGFISPLLRRRINRAMPYLMVCLGLWFILRGLGLDIPYLSPKKQVSGISICH
ncbi:MAG: hypothetical protein JWQ66_4206 [Mucilaginibacter sp.]|nr:hypothetical protein [Mucilaginibacter sp.]